MYTGVTERARRSERRSNSYYSSAGLPTCMYVGRFVVAGPGIGAYRVSSRSFPNREIRDRGNVLTVAPTADAPETDNPYVEYNCAREVERGDGPVAVVGNGSHVDPIAEKVGMGYPPRDALAQALLALDFEHAVCAAGVTIGEDGATVAVENGD